MASPEQAELLDRLSAMLSEANRGQLELGGVELAQRSRELWAGVEQAGGAVDLLWAAESAQLLAKLLEIKMGRKLEESGEAALSAPEPVEEEDPGARLAEYRLFKAAAGVLLADSTAGPKAFLRVLGVPVQPQSTIQLTPERLARVLGDLLARLPEPLAVEMTLPRYSVADKVRELRQVVLERGSVLFDELFLSARDRLEAVALFLALLELLKAGVISCTQERPEGQIKVERAGGD